jgi:gliding motility-associated-like protein
MKQFYLIILSCLIYSSLNAQTTFKKSYGGTGDEEARWMEMLADGSFVVCGRTTTGTNGNWDALLVKFDPQGNVVWSKSFGSPANDYLHMVKSTTDGGFIVTGTTFQAGSDGNLLAAKIDLDGEIIWQISLGAGFELEEGRGTCEVSDGYMFTGFSGSNSSPITYFAKTDLDGNLIWARSGIPGPAAEPIEANNGEIWVATAPYNSFDYDAAIIRMSSNGNILGMLRLTGQGNESCYYIKQTGDGFIVSDHSWVPSGNTQFRPWILKLNNSGEVIWSKSYDVGTNARTNAEVTADNGTIFCTYNFAAPGPKACMVKTNAEGNVIWAKSHTFPEGADGRLQYIKETPGGGFTAVGFCPVGGNGTDLVIFKTDTEGSIYGCCPEDINVPVQNYNPPQFQEFFDGLEQFSEQTASLATKNSAVTAIDQCDGPSCCRIEAGTMQDTIISICADETALFIHNGNQILDNGEILRFMLFSNPADTLGSIIAISPTPSFSFNPASMQIGLTYYIAAIAGNNLNGNIDLNNPCLDISNAARIVIKGSLSQIPNAFTPNNDGVNDKFRPLIACPPGKYHLRIFNRWGEAIFETTDYTDAWDGTYKGQQSPPDVFIWTLETDLLLSSYRGEVSLLR